MARETEGEIVRRVEGEVIEEPCAPPITEERINYVVLGPAGNCFWSSARSKDELADTQAEMEAEGFKILATGVSDDDAIAMVEEHTTPNVMIKLAFRQAADHPELLDFYLTNAAFALGAAGWRPQDPSAVVREGDDLLRLPSGESE
ncbi:hypothetical protein FJZ40_03535 [Candidatus Shapirobacteria bacterium]|nr:hypothetical protein [Candidatus Shapirobacteria bacterium]